MRVFVSYNRRVSDLAQIVRERLESSGLEVWDDTEILAGQDLGVALQRAVDESDAFVVLLSRPDRSSDFVATEIAAALVARAEGRSTRIIPVIAEKGAHVPALLMPLRHLDLADGSEATQDVVLDELVRSLLVKLPDESSETEQREIAWRLVDARCQALQWEKQDYLATSAVRERRFRILVLLTMLGNVLALAAGYGIWRGGAQVFVALGCLLLVLPLWRFAVLRGTEAKHEHVG